MSPLRSILMLGAALAALAAVPAVAAAQDSPAPAPAPADADADSDKEEDEQPATVEGVTVTARANDIRTSIDSISYSVAEDLQAATGTLADALRNIPSVDVDPQGNVSLRGDPGVTILVDGRPSGMLSGEGRGQALLQLSADQYSRIEVMTNPSAAYRPDGAGGVINLITRPNAPRQGRTMTGSVRANVGEDGRYNLGASAALTQDRLTLSGDVGLRHDTVRQEADRLRERLDPATGEFLPSVQSQDVEGENDSWQLRFSAEYKLDDAVQLTGEVRHHHYESEAIGVDLLEAFDADGELVMATRRSGPGGFSGDFSGATARVVRRFEGEAHEWSNELRYDRGHGKYFQDGLAEFLEPAAPSAWELLDNENRNWTLGFTSAYTRPMSDSAKLRAGYELQLSMIDFSTVLQRGPTQAAATPDPLVSNRFRVDQAVHALYGTYERPFGKLTAQFGLRLEQVIQDLDQVTTGTQDSNDAFDAYPSLHLAYELAENQTLRGSYSRRIQRPQTFDLNPFLIYQDAISYRTGNPDLQPQVTDSWELMWQRRVDQTFYQATLYYRDTSDAFTYVVEDVGGVLITRPENLGERTALGLELVANGRLHPTLRYNASLNLFQQDIEAAGVPGAQDSSGLTASARVSVNWQPTPEDFVQVSGLWLGDTLYAQGERQGGRLINLGYRRKLTEKLSFQLTVRDVFDEFGEVVIYETPTVRERVDRLYGGRMAYIGLTWSFGSGPQRPEQFDFSAPPTGG